FLAVEVRLSAEEKGEPKPQEKVALLAGKSVLKGKVTLEGDPPDLDKMNADLEAFIKRSPDAAHFLAEKGVTDRQQQVWRINKQNKGVGNIVVFLVPEPGTYFACGPDDEGVKA